MPPDAADAKRRILAGARAEFAQFSLAGARVSYLPLNAASSTAAVVRGSGVVARVRWQEEQHSRLSVRRLDASMNNSVRHHFRNMQQFTGNPPYSILSYSSGLRGFAMELSLLLPAVNGVLCRVAMSPAAGQGVVFAAAGSHGCQRPRGGRRADDALDGGAVPR
jgi:hypothetical protein